ncbi:fibronectin type III domain-containing protein [Costertonia aggregata]|uniref:Fibronectin type III domain-containing protein n=1 Tax=Costertonia aggregata TaxID=343403 RepID=A0A7H9ATM8_9FLAO|nr:fibronectin type III domain-containing protein [Costertonia aggregata]QLG46776.1 fibronectin type III domain-containing protein [Costertonia aggregata]
MLKKIPKISFSKCGAICFFISFISLHSIHAKKPNPDVPNLVFLDPDYQAILDEAIVQGYGLPGVTDQDIQNQIVISCKANGIWDKADVIFYFKGSGSKNFKLINWKNPSGPKAIEVGFGGNLTWSSTGVKGDGKAIINTNFNLSSGTNRYRQNNAGFYAYISQEHTTKFGFAGNNSNSTASFNILLRNVWQRQQINTDGSLPPVFDFSGTGLLGASRNNSSSFIASIGEATTLLTHASGISGTLDFTLLGYGSNLSSNFTRFDGEISYVLIGEDMSDKLNQIEATFSISTPSGNNADTQPPSAPLLASDVKTDTTVGLSWSGATDDTAVTGYKVYTNGGLSSTLGNVSSYEATGLTAATTYTFVIKALDAAGNESPNSNTISVTTDSSQGGGGPSGSGNWTLNGSNLYYGDGNIGIGTDDPGTWKLAVNGNVRAKEVKVETGWSDYVFYKDYPLPTLEEVEKHIKEKGHLINIPSAKEVEQNGIRLGEMNKLLLEKIEELTLYVISQKKELKTQREINKYLEQRLVKIERRIELNENQN